MMNLIVRTHGVTGMPDPEVGMGATEFMFSDRKPHTVIEVVSAKKIVVQGDDYERTDKNGMSDAQDYAFTRNPDAPKVVLTKRKNGWWVRTGESMTGTHFGVGRRDRYHDYSF